MTAVRHDHQAEMKSVNRLLEIAEMKHFLQEIETDKSQHLSPRRRYKEMPNKYQNRQASKNWSVSLKKSKDTRIQQFQHFTHGHHNIYPQENEQIDEQQVKNDRSSDRFPQVSRLSAKRDNILSMNYTFNPGSTARQSRNQNEYSESYRFIRCDELSSVFKNNERKPKNNAVYLRPNKSETIRELLNQMKVERDKDKSVWLNSLLYQGEEYSGNKSMIFSENQLKQLKKYKNFIPFREDQRLLIQKIGERQSIWKRKFKLSWQKRKLQLQTHKTNLKPIPKK